MFTSKKLSFLFALAILTAVFSFTPKAFAYNVVDADITENTTWTQSQSPYIVESNITVSANTTLTIEPGVVVKFNGTGMDIFGTINAAGSLLSPIYFTSYYDDEVGGNTDDEEFCYEDIDEQGNVLSEICETYDLGDPLAGDWGEIYFSNSTGSSLKNVFFRYADKTLEFRSSNANFENLNVSNSLSGLTGFNNSHIEIVGGTFTNLAEDAITFFNDSSLVFRDADISNVSFGGGIVIFNNSTLEADSVTIDNANASLEVFNDSIAIFDHSFISNDQYFFQAIAVFNNSSLSATGSIFDTGFGDGIVVFEGATLTLSNSTVKNFPHSGVASFGGDEESGANVISIDHSSIFNNDIGLDIYNGSNDLPSEVNITNNSIYGNTSFGARTFSEVITLELANNWWGDITGPYHEVSNPEGLGNPVSDFVNFTPWCTNEDCTPVPTCIVDCFSNVLFLPGLMGSKLYKQSILCELDSDIDIGDCMEKELWLSMSDSLQSDLSLDVNGKSINNVYTKNDTQKLDGDGDETGIIDDAGSLNIYQSFITNLKDWKQEGTIQDYAFIPYDWRLSLDDIITNGHVFQNGHLSYTTPQEFSESFILQKLEELQANSKSGKVTIIAHSNGGLVAKALIQKLQDTANPLYDKIDKVILVAVPQIGTPEAMATLLYGTKLGPFGFVMSSKMSRQLAENMPAIYNFLPSASYYTTVDPGFINDTLISFESEPFFSPQTSLYGFFVSTVTELKNYILGTDGRSKPSVADVTLPNIGDDDLYEQAEAVHQVLDSWTPSTETKVIQVAGWGEETLAGLDYVVIKGGNTEYLSFTLRNVVDGDGTVVVPSALWMSDSNPNVERWWVNLDEEGGPFSTDREHRDIFEIPNLLSFIKSKIEDITTFSDPDNIILDDDVTLISNKTRLHFTLHSPLTLGILDSEGRYTGLDPITQTIKEEIPDVIYRQIGDVQYLSVPFNVAYTVKLQGYAEGYFTLDVDKQVGNSITESISLEGIQSSTSTTAIIDIIPDYQVSSTQIKVDEDGDGSMDKTYKVVDGEMKSTNLKPISNGGSGSLSRIGALYIAIPVVETPTVKTVEDIAQIIQKAEEKSEEKISEEPPKIKEVKKEDKKIETKNIETVAEPEVQIQGESLSASALNSGVGSTWVPYVIILSILAFSFLFKIFLI